MKGLLGYLHNRELDLKSNSRVTECKEDLTEWLEKLSAKPVLNKPCDISGEPKATFNVDFSPDR